MTVAAIPSLDELAKNPAALDGLPLPVLRALAAKALVIQGAVLTAILSAPVETSKATGDRLMDVKETAAMLCRSPRWLLEHHAVLPFTVMEEGARPRFSYLGAQRYIRERLAVKSLSPADAGRKGA